MSQLARKTHPDAANLAPSASESLAKCKSLFTGEHTRCQIKAMYNKLAPKQRGLICIAGGLKPSEYNRDFESFDDLELQKIRTGMQFLKSMAVEFDSKLGDVRRLKHYQFSNTH